MNFFQQTQMGIASYLEAHQFIRKNGLWFYVLLPGIFSLLLLALSIIALWGYSVDLTNYIMDLMGIDTSGDSSWWMELINWTFLIIFTIIRFLIFIALYKYLVLILMSPIMAYLSERTEQILTGKDYPFDVIQFLKDVIRGVFMAIRNLIFEIGLTLLLLLLNFIPIIGFLSPILIFLVESYFLGFSMIDYYNERRKMSVGESIRFVRKNRGLAISNGAVFLLIMMIPILGVFIAPSYGVIAATISLYKSQNER